MTTITPAGFPFSMFDPIHLGMDENGEHVFVNLAERNMLLGGEPGAGKSSGINLIVAHGALSCDCKLILVDGKRVELGPWRDCADMFIGPSIKAATEAFEAFQKTMDARYDQLLADGRRKITRESGEPVYLIVIDEYAYFSATVGTKAEREKFAALTRDLVARGRAAGRHRHPGHPAALASGHRPIHAGPVRLPVGIPLHHRLQLIGHRARARLGRGRLHRRQHRPHGTRGRLAAVRVRCPAPDQVRLPHRRRRRRTRHLRRQTAARKRGRMSLAHALTYPYDRTPGTGPDQAGQCQGAVDTQAAAATCRERRVRRVRPARPARLQPPHRRGDIDALADMADLAAEIDTAMGHAVTGLREQGYSWADIGIRLGVTRQAAQQRWGSQ